MNKEIVIKSKDIKSSKLKFPPSGPWGKAIYLNNDKSASVIQVITSNKMGKPEMHEKLVDTFLILGGNSSLFLGGNLIGKKPLGGGDWIGEKLIKAKKYRLGAGDIVVIPKKTPHQHGPGPIKLLVIKTK